MKVNELPPEIIALQAKLVLLPDDCRRLLMKEVDDVVEATMRRRRILCLVQEALGQLRLDLKYLMFDLHATRKERDEALSK